MPKAKTVESKKVKKAKKTGSDEKETVELEEEVTEEESAQEELDPDILAALESKRAKKKNAIAAIDYIPELERDLEGSSTVFDEEF